MEIPYAVHPHPITGVPNGKLGIWLFLASEVMLFGALFSALILLRVGAENWPHGVEAGLSVPLATINTMVLITSSVTMVMSWASLKMNQYGRFQLYLGATILLACVFLVIKYFEYTDKFHHHHYPSTNTFLRHVLYNDRFTWITCGWRNCSKWISFVDRRQGLEARS